MCSRPCGSYAPVRYKFKREMQGHSSCLERLLPVGMGSGFEEAIVVEGALSLVLTDLLWYWHAVMGITWETLLFPDCTACKLLL